MNYLIVFLTCVLIAQSYGQRDIERVFNVDGVEVESEKVCLPDGTPCFIKCCGQEQVIYFTKSDEEESLLCINKTDSDLIDLSTYKDQLNEYSATMSTKQKNETFLYRKKRKFLNGINVQMFLEYEVEEENNRINTEYGLLTPPIYCYEMIVNDTDSYYAYLINVDDNSAEKTKERFVTYGCLVSVMFIFVTLIIHCLVKKLRRQKMYNYLLMLFLVSLMFAFLIDFLISTYEYWLTERGRNDEIYEVCTWLSPISYFFTLATFFWMNAMCYDICRNLSKMKVLTKEKIRVRAAVGYGLYAVGCPAVLTAFAVAINYSDDVPDSISKPAFEECMRDFGDRKAMMYKYLPMGVLVFANIVLFCLTIIKIKAIHKLTQDITTTQPNRKRQKLRVYISLSVLMGTSWVLECIQVLADIPYWLVYIIDFFNAFFGVIIFFITVFKRPIFVDLCKRFNIDQRWVRESPTTKDQSSKHGNSKSKGSYARTRTTDDSIQFDSINVSQDFDQIAPPKSIQSIVKNSSMKY